MKVYKTGGIFYLLYQNEKRNLTNKNEQVVIKYSVIEIEKNSHYYNLIKRGVKGDLTNYSGWNETIQGLSFDINRFVKNYVLTEVKNDEQVRDESNIFETATIGTRLKYK